MLGMEPVLVLELQLVLEPAQRRLAAVERLVERLSAAEQQVWKPGS